MSKWAFPLRVQMDVVDRRSENVERRLEQVTRVAPRGSREVEVERAPPARRQRLAGAGVVREREIGSTAARHMERLRRARAVVRDCEPPRGALPEVVVVVLRAVSAYPQERSRAQDEVRRPGATAGSGEG
jgi:hypothetical protein